MGRLWKCPKCGHRFTSKNLSHSCCRYRIQDHFTGKPRELRDTFHRFVAAARKCGPVTVYAQKTRIVLQHRVRFAAVTVRAKSLDAHLWVKRNTQHPLIHRTEVFGGNMGFACHFRLQRVSDVDQELERLMQEAYTVHQ